MRYIDSGTRDPAHALGTWLRDVVNDDVTEIRFQSGFFSSDSLHFLQPALSRLAENEQIARALVGSNDRSTIRQDVERLVSALRLPRNEGLLGIVSYDQGYYHPKTVHIRRADGSQAGYVGSANLTGSGIASLHIEAGITLDTHHNDPPALLDEMALAVDSWFEANPAGLYRVASPDDIEGLVRDGIIAERPVVRRPAVQAPRRRRGRANRLQPLIHIPRPRILREAAEVLVEAADIRRIILPAAIRHGFPPYLLFAPENAPTHGVSALSGSSLPAGVSGLIIRLNKDSGRHFEGRGGTANISVPVPSLITLRFGRSPQYQNRPRAEFGLRLRYVGAGTPIAIGHEDTNIMGYGFTGGTGHRDVRMVVPAATRVLAQQITDSGRPLPQVGDPALLEWPSADSTYEFRISFLQRDSQLFLDAQTLLSTAAEEGTTVGASACWLPENLSPEW
jgi:hypothetical protein